MMSMTQERTKAHKVELDDAALMYPDNQLGEQKHDYDETFSAFDAVEVAFKLG